MRGIFLTSYPKEILFTEQATFKIFELPRWEPKFVSYKRTNTMTDKVEDVIIRHKLPLYFPHRQNLRSGDLLQWRSETPIGASIRFARALRICISSLFRLKWVWPEIRDNHSSWVIKGPYEDGETRRWHCESVNKGLVPRILSERLCEHKGQVWWHPLIEGYDDRRECISIWAYDHLILGYDFLSIFRQIYRNVKIGTSRVFCSEAVCAVVKECGLTDNEKALPPDRILELGLWQKTGVRIK